MYLYLFPEYILLHQYDYPGICQYHAAFITVDRLATPFDRFPEFQKFQGSSKFFLCFDCSFLDLQKPYHDFPATVCSQKPDNGVNVINFRF